MLIIKELALATTHLDERTQMKFGFLRTSHWRTQRSIDFAAAVKFGSDSDGHATKPSDLTDTTVRSLSSLVGVEAYFNRSFQV